MKSSNSNIRNKEKSENFSMKSEQIKKNSKFNPI